MKVIGEEMHILNQNFVQALESLDKETMARMAREQVDAGAEALDINLGQVRQFNKLTPWLIETVQEATHVPLFLSSNVLNQKQALPLLHTGQATINAVTAEPAGLRRAMKTAARFQIDLVVLLVSSQLTPTNVNDRLMLASQSLEIAEQVNFPLEQLYFDPVIACRTDPTTWTLSAGLPDIDTLVESLHWLGNLTNQQVKTITGLSNASVCLDKEKRSAFQCRLLPLLAEAGLDAVIMNCRDQTLMDVAKNTVNNQHTLKALAA
jgi:cobalamin-dependent methionine synthase I